MEKRVIKVNLVGAICVLILIVAAIVGAVVLITKGVKTDKKKDTTDNNNTPQAVTNMVDSNENKEFKESVTINDQVQQITMKQYRSKLGYIMNYDIDNFYIEPDVDGVDKYQSQYTDKIYIIINRIDGSFADKSKEILSQLSKNKNENSTYEMKEENFSGKLCYKEQIEKNDETFIKCTIQGNDGYYFVVEGHCGNELKEGTLPIMELMIKSIEVM